MSESLPVYFISHGGGPWPWMDYKTSDYVKLRQSLSELPAALNTPPASILMISAHWEEPEFALTGSAAPPMIYDYFGFPEHTYQVTYGAPGNPDLAIRVKQLLDKNTIECHIDPERGFDHGMFCSYLPQCQYTRGAVIFKNRTRPCGSFCSG